MSQTQSRKRKTMFAVCLMLIACMMLTACKGKDDNGAGQSTGNPSGPADGTQVTIPGYEDGNFGETPTGDTGNQGDVSFGLQDPGDPNFSQMGSSIDDGLYTIENGYAYALDPNTFDKVGPALDPVTHEVLDPQPVLDGDIDSTPNDTQTDGDGVAVNPFPGEEVPSSNGEPSQNQPANPAVPDSVKLPNTGVFLEDD